MAVSPTYLEKYNHSAQRPKANGGYRPTKRSTDNTSSNNPTKLIPT